MTTARQIAGEIAAGAEPGLYARRALAAALGDRLNAFLHIDAAHVERQIAALTENPARRRGRLAGVPVAIKDNFMEAGQPCGCASKMLEGYWAPYTGTALQRLQAEGAILIGRTNMDEFAMGSSTENSAFGPTLNPLDPTRTPGGSSGGSAAAVAAGIVPLALGSETGGSVRQPAALCGVVGLKPSYGRISRSGLVAFASSLDCVAPFATDVRDCARITSVMAGADSSDSTTVDPASLPNHASASPDDWEAACGRGVRGLRVGVIAEAEGPGVEPGVSSALAQAQAWLRAAGATVQPVSIPSTAQALACYCILAPAELSANLARFDGVRYGRRDSAHGGVYEHVRGRFGPEVQRRLLLGTFVLSAGYAERYYLRAQALRRRMIAEMDAALQEVDLLLSPTSPTVAFPLGVRSSDPLAMYLSDIFTVPASLTGLPAISVPCGLSGGLPVGAQLTARFFEEAVLFAAAGVIEAGMRAGEQR